MKKKTRRRLRVFPFCVREARRLTGFAKRFLAEARGKLGASDGFCDGREDTVLIKLLGDARAFAIHGRGLGEREAREGSKLQSKKVNKVMTRY